MDTQLMEIILDLRDETTRQDVRDIIDHALPYLEPEPEIPDTDVLISVIGRLMTLLR